MIVLHVETPYASFRKSFARSFAETYALPPPATVYGMLLSLVGEHFRARHEGVQLAFAYKRLPRISTTIRKLSRFKYGVSTPGKLATSKPDYIETLCDIEFLCWVDSSEEMPNENGEAKGATLEQRLLKSLQMPHEITRRGVLSLGLSDDAVNEISLCEQIEGKWFCLLPDGNVGLPLVDEQTDEQSKWHRLLPNDKGSLELTVWVDHVGAADTRWRRFDFEKIADEITSQPNDENWLWTKIVDPRAKN